MFKKTLILALASTAAFSPASAAVNLLTNGSFETGLAGWIVGGTQNPGSGQADIVVIDYGSTAPFPSSAYGEAVPADNAAGNPGLDPVGAHAAYFSSDQAAPQTLSQSVQLLANTSYTFGFDVYKPLNGDNNPNGATFSATIAGNNFFQTIAADLPVQQWQHYSGAQTFTTDQSGLFTFSFTSSGFPAKDFAIDRVYLAATSAVVPEPASWALMMAGFGLLGGALRRKRATVRFA